MRLVPCCSSNRIMPENEGPGQVLFYEWKCIARGLANEPYLGNVIGGTIEFETSGWADAGGLSTTLHSAGLSLTGSVVRMWAALRCARCPASLSSSLL